MAPWHARREVRISFSALLRIRDDDRHVLLHSPSRPGSFNPPGGVYKCFGPAAAVLEGLGFRADRADPLADDMRSDLRGFLPASALPGFRRWFACGAYRESPAECLRRELAEELAESGVPHLVPDASRIAFRHLRSVDDGPHPVPGKPFRQLRRFEVYEPVVTGAEATRLCRSLAEAAADPAVPAVICATPAQILHGRSGTALIGGHAAYLIGDRRAHPELPMVR
ncbi:hypothetical protein GCM10023085_26750 [Actinomadura viridis]|uniref:CD-NTase-associated protein 16 NUDIX domain-containing protein n=1 Tax=Actinomadura viridis TaxID=58110 RepID=A0A931DIH2_9ACTN|nr:hypothetical protein [Actinomadura viridis]MBG6087338.1 hypothetical protein [Actinomadura viridis]